MADSGNGGGGGADRGERGQFAPGNHASPGRPKGSTSSLERRRCLLRGVLTEEIPEQRLREQVRDLAELAKSAPRESDRIAALKLLWSYALGAPQQEVTVLHDDGFNEALQQVRAELAARVHPVKS